MTIVVEDSFPPLITSGELCATKPAAAETSAEFSSDENAGVVTDAKRVVSGLRSGVREVIDACVLAAATCERFPDSIDDFLDVMVAGNIISAAERRLGPASPKLSKLRTIGKHAELLNREEIFPHLVSGFTVIHQLLVLFKKLEGDDEERVSKLVDILKLQPTLSMDFLKKQTDLAKKKRNAAPPNELSAGADGLASTSDGAVEPVQCKYVQVLLTPDFYDIRRVNEYYPESGDYPRCLRVHEDVDDDCTAIVVARLIDFPIVANRLLPHCGFDRVSRVMRIHESIDRDITDAEVVIIAQRGRKRFEIPRDFVWPATDEAIDAVSIATRLMPEAANRLHVFATHRSEAWTSLVGDENWERLDD